MESQQIVQNDVVARERPWLRPIGIVSILAVVLVMGSTFLATLPGKSDSAHLLEIHRHAGKLLAGSVLGALGFAMLAAPFGFLFRAAQARSDRVKPGLFWLTLLAPIFVGASVIVHAAASTHVASHFVHLHGGLGNSTLATRLIQDSSLLNIANGLGFAGAIGVAVGGVYSTLWGYRVGLMRRFLGTFGITVAALFPIIPYAAFGLLIWSLGFGLMLLALQRDVPSAWTMGVAMPWPKPGSDPKPDPEERPESDPSEPLGSDPPGP